MKTGAHRLHREVAQGLVEGAEFSQGYMKDRKLSGSPVKVQTGRLRSGWSVPRPTIVTPELVEAGYGTRVKYARAQNYGFAGPVQVMAHTRRRRAGGGQRKPGKGAKLRKKTAFSREQKSRTELTQRRQNQSQASHGLSVSAKQKQSRDYRRATGQQAGTSRAPALLREKARKSKGGLIAVGAHGRYMKIQAKRFVESSLRETKRNVVQLVQRRVGRALPTVGR